MRVLLMVVAMTVLVGCNTRGGVGRGVAPGGSCVEYPTEGQYCSGTGLGGLSVFHFDGIGTLEERSARLERQISPVQRAAQDSLTPECIFHSRRLWCLMWFPRCDANQHPVLPCKDYCETVHENYCLAVNQLVIAYGFPASVVRCGAAAGDPANQFNEVLPFYLAGWEGRPVFQSATYVDTALPGSPTLTCAGEEGDATEHCQPVMCTEPFVEARFPLLAAPLSGSVEFSVPEDVSFCANLTNDMDCDRCFGRCEIPCKYDFLFPEREFAAMAAVQWVPGLLAFPLNLLILVSEHFRLKTMAKSDRVITERLVYFIAIFGILLFLVDGLPALLVGEQVRCAGSHVHSIYTNVDGSDWCWFAKIKVHILQALMFTVVATLYRVRMQLLGTLIMKSYKAPRRVRMATGFAIFVLPLLLALVTFLGESDQLYEASVAYREDVDAENGVVANYSTPSGEEAVNLVNGSPAEEQPSFLHTSNNVRYAFSCGPKFRTVAEELLVFQGPLIVAGVLCLGLSASLLNIVRKMAVSFSTNAGSGSEEASLVRRLTVAMMRFAVINVSLVVLNTVSTTIYLPQSLDISRGLTIWGICINTGVNFDNLTGPIIRSISTSLAENEARCGRLADIAPSSILIIVVQGAQTVPPLAFGLVFVAPALKQLKHVLKRARRHKVGPSGRFKDTTNALSTENND